MKKAVFGIQILVLIIALFVVVLLGFEIYGHRNPDNMIIEAIILGICLVVNIICAFYKLYIDKK
jgi:divalent metal cation (Fe/Co/Zn/Cd) transporter